MPMEEEFNLNFTLYSPNGIMCKTEIVGVVGKRTIAKINLNLLIVSKFKIICKG